ncbi:hypothetical protein E2C01_024655 [Portunus trituberculatus]|uniref:Uncharacterized protein n=1 Tax=Portunus trituberculatus TaxID=210409 RepID=A0A5B7EDG0_PORTR|nr:hypothetical protein [Portunus trituberculatus]
MHYDIHMCVGLMGTKNTVRLAFFVQYRFTLPTLYTPICLETEYLSTPFTPESPQSRDGEESLSWRLTIPTLEAGEVGGVDSTAPHPVRLARSDPGVVSQESQLVKHFKPRSHEATLEARLRADCSQTATQSRVHLAYPLPLPVPTSVSLVVMDVGEAACAWIIYRRWQRRKKKPRLHWVHPIKHDRLPMPMEVVGVQALTQTKHARPSSH